MKNGIQLGFIFCWTPIFVITRFDVPPPFLSSFKGHVLNETLTVSQRSLKLNVWLSSIFSVGFFANDLTQQVQNRRSWSDMERWQLIHSNTCWHNAVLYTCISALYEVIGMKKEIKFLHNTQLNQFAIFPRVFTHTCQHCWSQQHVRGKLHHYFQGVISGDSASNLSFLPSSFKERFDWKDL